MKLMRQSGWLRIVLALLAGAAAFGQPAGAQVARAQPDLFDSMVASAASFDMDSPVEAQAEFDPPVAAPGTRVIYRVTESALDESLEVPAQLPTPDGLELTAGGRGQNYVPTADRKVRPECTLIFHAIAPTNGSFTIPAFQAMAYGKPVQIPAATLNVSPEGAAAPQTPALLVNLPAGDVYVGETFAIPLALPRPPDNSVLGMSEPRITGQFIFSEELPAMVRQENIEREGRSMPALVSDVVITPLREGPQPLVGQAFCVGMRPVPGRTNASRIANELVDSGPVTLVVHPLPADGRLPGFTGAVGQFKLDPPVLSANRVHAGEPLTLTLTIRSPGEIGRVTPPPPPAAEGWQSFPPVAGNSPSDNPQERDFESFNYTLIPASSESKSTPPIPFSYFDPQQKAYVDLTIASIPVTVDPAPPNEAQTPLLRETPRPGTDDASNEKELVLAGLSAAPGPSAATLAPLQQSGWFWAMQLVPAAVLAGLWAWDKRRRHLREHPEIVHKRRARRGLRRQLRLARRAAAAKDPAGFARGAADALREACAPHGAANPAALVCADVLQELPAQEQHGPAGDTVRRLFAAADALRFGGPAGDGSRLLALQPELEQLLEQLKTRL